MHKIVVRYGTHGNFTYHKGILLPEGNVMFETPRGIKINFLHSKLWYKAWNTKAKTTFWWLALSDHVTYRLASKRRKLKRKNK